MKVLFSGYKNPHFMAVTDYIEIGLKEMGHEVHFFDYRSYLLPGRIRDRVPALERWDLRRLNGSLRERARALKPDLFLVAGGHTIEPETIQAAKSAGATTALWTADYPHLIDIYIKLAPHYDRCFVSGSDALSDHRAAGNERTQVLPFGCLPDLHKPMTLDAGDKARFSCDVFFAGTAYPDRVTALEAIAEIGGLELAIWGPCWEDLAPGHPLKRFVRGGPLNSIDYVKAASACKIAFNHIGGFGHMENRARIRMANSRLYELLGCGACQLVDAKEDVVDAFPSGRELVWFKDRDDMLRLVRLYLGDDKERAAIGRRARESAVAVHTYRLRLTALIAACGLSGRS